MLTFILFLCFNSCMMPIFFLLCMCLTTRVQAGEKSQVPVPQNSPPPPLLFPYDDVIVQYDVTVPRRGIQEKNGLPFGASTVCRYPDASVSDFCELLFYAKSWFQDSELWCLMCASLHNAHTGIVLSLLYKYLCTVCTLYRYSSDEISYSFQVSTCKQLAVANYV